MIRVDIILVSDDRRTCQRCDSIGWLDDNDGTARACPDCNANAA